MKEGVKAENENIFQTKKIKKESEFGISNFIWNALKVFFDILNPV